jgi:triphosphoribosyl-dephospho-CoA synthase
VIEAAFRAACEEEIRALKPGNVHAWDDGHRMTAADFLCSAEAAAGPLCATGTGLGRRVLGAVQATRAAVGQNTNLGILLLCAPLALAAEAGGDLRAEVRRVIAAAGVADTALTFQAIVLAAPGGLGSAARHDVHAPATVPLLEAMAEAAARDRIAGEYVTGFAEVFETGLSAYAQALERWVDRDWAAVAVYLRLLASGLDSHVVRKLGAAVATEVRRTAGQVESTFLAHNNPATAAPALLAWDGDLKQRGINPGTCADLTVATIFAGRLLDCLARAG